MDHRKARRAADPIPPLTSSLTFEDCITFCRAAARHEVLRHELDEHRAFLVQIARRLTRQWQLSDADAIDEAGQVVLDNIVRAVGPGAQS